MKLSLFALIAVVLFGAAPSAHAQQGLPRVSLEEAERRMANEDSIQRSQQRHPQENNRRQPRTHVARQDTIVIQQAPQQRACQRGGVYTDSRTQTHGDTVNNTRTDRGVHVSVRTAGTAVSVARGRAPISIHVEGGTRSGSQRTTRNGSRSDSRTRTSCENGYPR